MEEKTEKQEQRLKKGKFFSSRKESTKFIKDIALRQGKRAVINHSISGGANFRYECHSKTSNSSNARKKTLTLSRAISSKRGRFVPFCKSGLI
jgi:hypothetical protein